MSIAIDDKFSETAAGADRVVFAGEGPPVIVFAAGFARSAAHRALAARFCVYAYESGAEARAAGHAAAAWAEAQNFEKIGLIGAGARAGAAIWAAHALGERASALVLASPRDLPLGGGDDPLAPLLRGVLTAKLILVGDEDGAAPADALSVFKKAFSRANVALIHGAGAEIAHDRPAAFVHISGDFLDRQERFRFMTESVAVSP